MDEKPRQRWFRFSLRTLFVVVLLFAIPLGWVGYNLNWIRQRDAALRKGFSFSTVVLSHEPELLPWGLRVFGAQTIGTIYFDDAGDEEMMVTSQLFPESQVFSEKDRVYNEFFAESPEDYGKGLARYFRAGRMIRP